MQLTDRELAEISKQLADAEATLAALSQKSSEITAELGLVVIRGALVALDESAADATHAARTLQKLRLALATLNVPSRIHEHVCEAFRVLGKGHEAALRQVEAACLADARYRELSLRAELQGVRAELAGEHAFALFYSRGKLTFDRPRMISVRAAFVSTCERSSDCEHRP